jgi:hypothetical protein
MSDLSTKSYDYPVYGTQGGGLVRSVGQTYIFVEKPDCPGLDVGDKMPEEWGVIPANEQARREVDDARDFEHGLDEFFDLAFAKVDAGEMSLEQVGEFFPKDVRDRNK